MGNKGTRDPGTGSGDPGTGAGVPGTGPGFPGTGHKVDTRPTESAKSSVSPTRTEAMTVASVCAVEGV